MATYSFLSVNASISGPGGSFSLGQGAGVADEGISFAAAGDKNVMQTGAGGDGQHSLRATDAGKVTVRLLKTSVTNQKLSQMYALQKSSPALWGINTFVLNDTARGDVVAATQCAFTKAPDLAYATEAGLIEWEFDAISIDRALGSGAPVAS